MNDAIGQFEFIGLHGTCEPPAEQIGPPIVRPGIDGVGLWKTGVRGRQSVLRSVVDAANKAEARAKLVEYLDLIGADPVALVQADCDYTGEGWQIAVLGVRKLKLQEVLTPSGGLNSPSLAKLTCEWRVIAVAVM